MCRGRRRHFKYFTDYFACRTEKGTMEQGDARATMGLQDALELLPQEMHSKIVPATRTFVLRRTSKTMRAAVDNDKVDVVVVRAVSSSAMAKGCWTS